MFIKLTPVKNAYGIADEVYVNVANIAHISKGKHTVVHMISSDDDYWEVDETPEEIFTLINKPLGGSDEETYNCDTRENHSH